MRKKGVSFLLCAVLAVTALAGCGGGTAASQTEKAAETQGETSAGQAQTETAAENSSEAAESSNVAEDSGKTAAELKPSNWPKSPISLMVGSAAGGGTDIMARMLAEAMNMDVAVNIINRNGASGTIAAEETAVSAPDGYTINVGMPAAYYIQPHLVDLTYDPFGDFRHIAVISPDEPLVIVVPVESSYESFSQVEEDMKGGKAINFGTSNPGSVGNCGLSDLFLQAGVYESLTMLPFGGSAETLTALQGGHIDVCTLDLAEALPRVNNGTLRALAVFGSQRCPSLPDVPCTEELGYKDLDYVIAFKWISVPRDTPEEIVAYLKAVFNEAVLSDTYADYIKSLNGLDTYTLTEEELTDKLKGCYDSYDGILRKIGTHKELK